MMRHATDGLLVKHQLHVGKNAVTVITWSETYVVGTWKLGWGGGFKPINFAIFSIEAELVVLAT